MLSAVLFLLASTSPDAGPRPVEVPAVADVDAGTLDVVDAGPAATPGFSVSARLEPDPVDFGGRVELVVTVVRPPRRDLEIPKDIEPDERLPRSGDLRRVAHEVPAPAGVSPDAGPGDRVQEELRFPFLALDVKDLTTPAFVIKCGDVVLEVPALPVRVKVEPIDENAGFPDGGAPAGALVIDGAAPALVYRVSDERPFIALGVLFFVVVAFFVIRHLLARARRAKAALPPPPAPRRPAWETAIERLDALMPLLQRGEVTIFVEKMMDEVLRDYLAGRFALATGTRTTKEIVIDLLGITSTSLDIALVEEVGKDADLVKFARANLAAQQAHAMAGRVRALILATADRAAATTTTTPTTTPSTTTPSTTEAP